MSTAPGRMASERGHEHASQTHAARHEPSPDVAPSPAQAAQVLDLQRSVGNRAVTDLLRRDAGQSRSVGPVQARSAGGTPSPSGGPRVLQRAEGGTQLDEVARERPVDDGSCFSGQVPSGAPTIRRSPADHRPEVDDSAVAVVPRRSVFDSLRGRAAQAARNTPGYPLLTVVLGRDPIVGMPVERTATNLLRGLTSLAPGGAALFDNLQQSGALDRAHAWIADELRRLNLTWDAVSGAFRAALDAASILHPIDSVERIINVFTPLVGRLHNFAVDAGGKLLELIFESVVSLAGPVGQQVLGIIRRAGDVFSLIIRNPVGFLGNLVQAVTQGFRQFSSNILIHLRAGLMGWLFGALAGAGLQMPQQFDLRGILSIVLQILGLTYERLRGVLSGLIGADNVARAERAFEFLRVLVTQGIGAAWQKILEFAEGLIDTVISAIRDWVAETIVGQAIARLVSMFTPVGALTQAITSIYHTVEFFIQRAGQIVALANSVFDSISTIASGNVVGAATYVEQTMARALPVAIGFLAGQLGLGNIATHIRGVIERVHGIVDGAMTRVAGWIVGRVHGLIGRVSGGEGQDRRSPKDKERDLATAMDRVRAMLADPTISAAQLRRSLPGIRSRYALSVLSMSESLQSPGTEQVVVHGDIQRATASGEKPALTVAEAQRTVDEFHDQYLKDKSLTFDNIESDMIPLARRQSGLASLRLVRQGPVREVGKFREGQRENVRTEEAYVSATVGATTIRSQSVRRESRDRIATRDAILTALRDWESRIFHFGAETFILDRRGMAHIIERHHPEYWQGEVKETQSFFHPRMAIDEIADAVAAVLQANREVLTRRGARGKYKVYGGRYTLGLNNGRVGQFF